MKKKIYMQLVVLAVLAVLVILLWLGPFDKVWRRTEYSGIMIKEINTIAEWVGSEYRGEVLVSLQEVEENKRRQECRVLYQQCANMDAVDSHWQAVKKDSNFVLMRKATALDTSAFKKFIMQNSFDAFQQRFIESFEKNLTDAAADDLDYLDLVYIARGRVNAGFDFSQVKRRDVELAGDTLKIYNLYPQILDVIINPWFDTAKKLKGYDLVRVSNERKIKLHHQNRVKEECLVKLENVALEKEILIFAENAGKEYVLSLVQLLLPEKSIQTVLFPGVKSD